MKYAIFFSASFHYDHVLLSLKVYNGEEYTAIQKFGVSKMYSSFWKAHQGCIYLIKYGKTSNIS